MTSDMEIADQHRRRSLRVIFGAACAVTGINLLPRAQANEARVMFEGQGFERRVSVAGTELQLNGTGVRQVAWFKGYLAALYLAAPARSVDQAVRMDGAKRIQLRVLHDVPAVEFSKAVRKGMLRNAPAQEQTMLAERLDRFVRQIDAIDKIRKNDEINLDYEPGRGLLMYVNAAMRGQVIPGEDFYGALLRSFLGDRPYDERMREGLLGKRS